MTFTVGSDERVNLLYKKYARSASTTTLSASIAGEATEMKSRGSVVCADDVYAQAVPTTAAATDSLYQAAGDAVTVNINGSNVDLGAAASDLAAAHGLTEDIWQAFKDGELAGAATLQGLSHIVLLTDLVTSHVTSTLNLDASPAYHHPCLKDALPSTAFGNAYPVTLAGYSTTDGSSARVEFTSTDDGNWVLQPESGILQFMDSTATTGGVPLFDRSPDGDAVALFNLAKTPMVTFYRYVGTMLDEHLQADLVLGAGPSNGFVMGSDPARVYFDSNAAELVVTAAVASASTVSIPDSPLRLGQLSLTGYVDPARANACLRLQGDSGAAGLGAQRALRGVDSGAGGLYDRGGGAWTLRCLDGSVELRHSGTARLTTEAAGVYVGGLIAGVDTIGLGDTAEGDHATGDGEFHLTYSSAHGLRHYHPVEGWQTYMDTENSSGFSVTPTSVSIGSATVTGSTVSGTNAVVVTTNGSIEGISSGGAAFIDYTSGTGTGGVYSDTLGWVLQWNSTATNLVLGGVNRMACASTGTTVTGDLAAPGASWTSALVDGSPPLLASRSMARTISDQKNKWAGTNGAYTQVFSTTVTIPETMTYLVQLDGTGYVHSSDQTSKTACAQNPVTTYGVRVDAKLTVGSATAHSCTVIRGVTSANPPLLPLCVTASLSAGNRTVTLGVTSSSSRPTSFYDMLLLVTPAGPA